MLRVRFDGETILGMLRAGLVRLARGYLDAQDLRGCHVLGTLVPRDRAPRTITIRGRGARGYLRIVEGSQGAPPLHGLNGLPPSGAS